MEFQAGLHLDDLPPVTDHGVSSQSAVIYNSSEPQGMLPNASESTSQPPQVSHSSSANQNPADKLQVTDSVTEVQFPVVTPNFPSLKEVEPIAVDAHGGPSTNLVLEPHQIAPSPPLGTSPGPPFNSGTRIFLDICCGVNSPLSNAVHHLKGDIMRFDVLVHSCDDLLNSDSYERLLRLCASGLVAYAGASPACCEYSRLKLLPHGPPALRTPSHMQGVPGISGPDLQKVQDSYVMLERCINCLNLTIAAGGHGHLEQPKSAMSWDEPIVQQYIKQNAACCISMAACGYGRDWHKFWMFASTYMALAKMACACSHPAGSHQQIAGVRTPTGHYLSRATAEYPSELAQQFAQIVMPLLSDNGKELTLLSYEAYLPIKKISDPPFSRQDGAGFVSQSDWSCAHGFEDSFQVLRKNFFREIMSQRLDLQVLKAFRAGHSDPPFSQDQLLPFKKFVEEFLMAQGFQPDWSIPPDQQLCLHVLQRLCQCMQDPDTALFPYLINGVPLGINESITPSGCFPLNQPEAPFEPPLLSLHHTNWQSAEDEPTIVQELIDKEIDAGWVSEFQGTIEDAQAFFPDGLAIGKLGLALSDSRPPRLVLDSTVCGVNPQSQIPEKASLPTAKDVIRAYPLRQTNKSLSGVSFDVKSAHKQMAVHPRYRGFMCFQFKGRIFYYKVCPFGAVVSAHFWSRLGGVFQRLFHRMIYLPHASFLYVDDLLMFQESSVIGLSAAVIAVLCMLTRLPISWKKCEIGPVIVWIGWEFHISSGFIILPAAKRDKLMSLLEKLQSSSHCSKKALEKFLGLALWATQLWPAMRTWLHYLYRDLHSIPASQFSVDPGCWEDVCACVSDELVFVRKPPFTAIPVQGHLIQVRHQPVTTKSDLFACSLSDKRVWLRIRDPNSSKRKLSTSSQRILSMYVTWLNHLPPVRTMWPKQQWTGLCVADAFASGTQSGIGGAIVFPSGQCSWFSLQINHEDFKSLHIPIHDNLQKDITSLETLAQIALVYITIQFFPGSRIPIRIPTLSDNTTAEATSNKLFSTSMPIALFLEKLSLLISSSCIEVDVSHIPGHNNDWADALSRWDGAGQPPHHFLLHDRYPLTLSQLWNLDARPRLFPPDTQLPWQFPT